MIKKTIIIGLNSNLKNIIPTIEGPIIVIDELSVKEHGSYINFESDKVIALYQASLKAGQVEHDNFEASQEFYDVVHQGQFELEYQSQKDLIKYLSKQNIEIKKGRFKIISETSGELVYLGNSELIEFTQIILNTGFFEDNPFDSPFVFTFEQFLHSNQLVKRILVDAKSLRGLEMASMFARFGSEVVLVSDRKLFSQIEHLMFRDAIRETLIKQNIKLMERYKVDEIVDLEKEVSVFVEPISQLAFEIGEPLKPQVFTVDVVIVESEPFKPFFMKSEIDMSQALQVSNSLFLDPVLSIYETGNKGDIYQFDAQEFMYFSSRFEIDGGIELMVKDGHFVNGIFYCLNALEFTQLLRQNAHLTIEEFSQLDVFNNSQLGVFKQAAVRIIEEKGGNNAGKKISRLN